jgi:hypothetical protein
MMPSVPFGVAGGDTDGAGKVDVGKRLPDTLVDGQRLGIIEATLRSITWRLRSGFAGC